MLLESNTSNKLKRGRNTGIGKNNFKGEENMRPLTIQYIFCLSNVIKPTKSNEIHRV